MDCAAVRYLPDDKSVAKQLGHRAHAERDAATGAAGGENLFAGADAPVIQIVDQGSDRADLEIAVEDQPDGLGVLGYDDELLVDAPITERDRAADPNPFF